MVENTYFQIGKASKLCGVPIKTLRYYDQIGLLVPKFRNDETGYRYYTQEQLLTLFMIRKLRTLGVPIKEIKAVVLRRDAAAMGKAIEDRLDAIQKDIEDLTLQYRSGKMLLDRLDKSIDMRATGEGWYTEDIRLETIPASNVIYTRRVKKDYHNTDVSIDRWFELFQMVAKQNLVMTGSVILTYHNEPLEQFYKDECDLEIAVPVNEIRNDTRRFKTFGGYEAVTAIHVGRNDQIIQSHIKAIKWLEKEGYRIAGPISEEYILSPLDINNEEEQITKVIIPVTKAQKAK